MKRLPINVTGNQRGVALVSVLWTVILLTVIASTLIGMTVSHGKSMEAARSRLIADQAAEAGIALALVELADPHGGWPMDGTKMTVSFNNFDIEVSTTAESGKIDLNTADQALIRGLLTVEGAGSGDAETISERILARRTPQVEGSQGNSIEGGAVPTRNGGFENVSELMQIQGMTRSLYYRLVPNLTLYSGSSSVDISVAPQDVILSIPGNTMADAEAALRNRAQPLNFGQNADLSRIVGHAFSLTATARLPGGVIGQRREIVRLTGNPKDSIWILAYE